jgi:GNAT superfamily N-acetyltransferase
VHVLELLSKRHDREGFDSGSEPLNLFLRQTARQHTDRGISRTFVLIDEEGDPKIILGFFSLNFCQIRAESLASKESKNLPRDVAGVRLRRLAVSLNHQRKGLGRLLLVAAMQKFLEIHGAAGGIGLFVDAMDLDAQRYYEQFGFVPMPSNELELFLPLQTIQEALDAGCVL